MSYKSISIIGLGYIGLPTAAVLASHMGNVIGVDVCPEVVEAVNTGTVQTVEPGLATLLEQVTTKGQLRAVLQPEPVDAFIIAVPTPISAEHKPDISYVKAAALSLAPVLCVGNLIILESTSPVGTTEQMAGWLVEARPDLSFPMQAGDAADVQIAYCPERILPGKMLTELVNNDRVVGGLSDRASAMSAELYKIFVKGEIVITNARTSELCKLTENSFRDVNIAFANEMSMICDKLDIDVWELIKLANRHPRVNILQPGCGVGGHCIPVDPWFIVDSAPEEAKLIRAAREVNDYKTQWVFEKIKVAITSALRKSQKSIFDVTVCCIGLAYKQGTDDIRNSPNLALCCRIASLGCNVLVIDSVDFQSSPICEFANIKAATLEEAMVKSDIVCIFIPNSELNNLLNEEKYKIILQYFSSDLIFNNTIHKNNTYNTI